MLVKRSVVAFLAAGCMGYGVLPSAKESPDPLGERVGGDTTVDATGRNAFSFPLANLVDEERTRFVIGNSFFKRNWVEAPASTHARDGLGPHFIARSCAGCHVMDGRGAPPDYTKTLGQDPEPTVALLIRLSVNGNPTQHDGVVPHPVYGDQFNNAAIQGVKPEGVVRIRTTTITGRFADGTRYTLVQPKYKLTDLSYGLLAADIMMSPRIAPHLAGVGLLEAVDEADILHNVQVQADQPGPIKGKPNWVWDAFSNEQRIGRFGWKANVATLAHQTASAFLGDMGITSTLFPKEACSDVQHDCLEAPHGGGKRRAGEGMVQANSADASQPEIDDETLANTVFYQATLAPAARRNASDPAVLRGQKLFAKAQCSTCHRPSYLTKAGPFPRLTTDKLSGQTIWPYTDLLLHDMGPQLADGRPDFQANGQQWKTAPLWGIGLIKDVNGHQRLLHDGRARGVLEAVLWHGGEAESSKRYVLNLNKAERDALVKFVESL